VAGGAIGLASLGTVPWTVVASTARSPANAARAAAAAAAARAGHPLHATAGQVKAAQASIFDHALPAGFSRGFVPSAGNAEASPRSPGGLPTPNWRSMPRVLDDPAPAFVTAEVAGDLSTAGH
jgi:hypothetical protein